MSPSPFSLRVAVVAGAISLGSVTAPQASVLYSYVGTTEQDFFNAGLGGGWTHLVYDVIWTATFADFVTTAASAAFDSCSITKVSASAFDVTKICGPSVTLSNGATEDIVGFPYSFPDFGAGGVDGTLFTHGAFLSEGVYTSLVNPDFGVVTSGKLTVKDLSIVEPPPVPLPAAGLMLVSALGGLTALRRRKAV